MRTRHCKLHFSADALRVNAKGMKLVPYVCLFAAFLLAACSSPAPSTQRTAPRVRPDSYATLYLGANGQVVSKSTQAAKPQAEGYWNGNGVDGAPSIVIDTGSQEARFYKGGRLVGISPISSGREGYRTPTGSFSIIQKDKDHLSNLYGDYVDASGGVVAKNIGVVEDPRPPGTSFRGAPMPYYMRITGGVGMHAGYLPGVPDSHGCIRMPMEMAEIFYENAPAGTPVRITH